MYNLQLYNNQYLHIYVIIVTLILSTCLSIVSTLLLDILYLSNHNYTLSDNYLVYSLIYSLTFIFTCLVSYVIYKKCINIYKKKNNNNYKEPLLEGYGLLDDPLSNI